MSLLTGLISYWKLDESSGNASDSVGTNTMTNTGTATFGVGLINNGAYLSGTGQYFQLTTPGSDLRPAAITIQAWVYFNSVTGSPYVLSLNYTILNTSPFNSYALVINGAKKLQFYWPDANSSAQIGSTIFTTGQWYHLVATYDGTNKNIYVNGSLDASAVAAGALNYLNGTLQFGTDVSGGQLLNGRLDEIGIWSRALSGTEISQLYNSGAGFQYPFGGAAAVNGLLMASD